MGQAEIVLETDKGNKGTDKTSCVLFPGPEAIDEIGMELSLFEKRDLPLRVAKCEFFDSRFTLGPHLAA